jgi:hypothetical protein
MAKFTDKFVEAVEAESGALRGLGKPRVWYSRVAARK